MGDVHPKAMAGTPEIIQDGNLKIYKYPNDIAIYSDGDDIWHYAPSLKGIIVTSINENSGAPDEEEREKRKSSYPDIILKFKKLFSEELKDPMIEDINTIFSLLKKE
jgi:hypothetical protein